ncbi:MAG: RNA polymerase sigma factor [Phycisphaerales bacterium]|nr:RNA polymerase sigma factor [Phycisphaerales bacterium]
MADTTQDIELVRRIGRRDIRALESLANRYEPLLLGLARGLLSQDESTARDVVQDCWIRVIRSAAGFRGECEVRTWLYRIVINRCHDLRAKRAIEIRSEPEYQAEPVDSEAMADLRRAVDSLAHDHRLLVLLCYHSGLTHPQVADVLGVPEGTVKSRLHAALEVLRTRLTEDPARHGAQP